MATYPDPAFIEPVVETSRHDLDGARAFLAGRSVPPDVAEWLVETAFDRESSDIVAARVLRMMRPAAEDVLTPALEALARAPTRQAGLIALGGLPGEPRAVEALYGVLRGGTPADQRLALTSLTRMRVPSAVTIVIEAASRHPEPAVRLQALTALPHVTTREAAARAALVRMVETERDRAWRAQARTELARFDGRRRARP